MRRLEMFRDPIDARAITDQNGRLADLLHTLSRDTQFLLVTHSKRMMQAADLIYGVTMQEPGVSKVVSVRLGGNEKSERRNRADFSIDRTNSRAAEPQLATA